MKSRIVASAALMLAAACLPRAALANALEEKNVVSGKTALDPRSGYVFLTGKGRQIGIFIREPDAEDVAAYQAERDKAFAAARKKYEKALKRWQSDSTAARQAKTKPPEKPVEPVDETFSIGAIERWTTVQFGPDYAFAKDRPNDLFHYLMAVKPGVYSWYGPAIFDDQQGYIGACYCMGTVKFEVKPGVITNLGNFLTAAPLAEKQKRAPMPDFQHSGGWNGFRITLPDASAPVSFALPPSLARWPSVQAEFSASRKFDNFYGIMVSRLPEIPGVLAYDRDRIVDLKATPQASAAR